MSYTLHIGCHKGTSTSKDSENRPFETFKEAEDSYLASKGFWASIGYYVWFANITDDDDNDKKVVRAYPGTSYV